MNATAKTVATYAAAGMNDSEIAAKMGLCSRYIYSVRRENGIPSPHTQNVERRRRDVVWMHSCGLTDEEIALTTGDNRTTIRTIRRSLGLKANKPFVPRSAPPRIQAARKMKAAAEFELRKSGLPDAVKIKPVARSPKHGLHDQIRPIRAAIGGVFDRAPSVDVQGAVAVAMMRLHHDRAFARAWVECGA